LNKTDLVRRVKMTAFRVAPAAVRAWTGPASWPYAISIYKGASPFDLQPAQDLTNPVIRPTDVSDTLAGAVADPFLFRRNDRWFLFFEIVSQINWRGEISYASSDDGIRWTYGSLIIQEPFHMSYPYVFEWGGDIYMIPEFRIAGSSSRRYWTTTDTSTVRYSGTTIPGTCSPIPAKTTCDRH
jgi:hypothetical protein